MAVSRNSLLLFAASWLLLAVFLLPAQASAAGTATTATGPAQRDIATIPFVDNTITIGEADLAWPETGEEAGKPAKVTLFRYLTEVAASP